MNSNIEPDDYYGFMLGPRKDKIMDENVTIVRVETDDKNAKVILSNGTVLVDLIRVETKAAVNDITTVELTACVLRCDKRTDKCASESEG